jgi:hypothetical protein
MIEQLIIVMWVCFRFTPCSKSWQHTGISDFFPPRPRRQYVQIQIFGVITLTQNWTEATKWDVKATTHLARHAFSSSPARGPNFRPVRQHQSLPAAGAPPPPRCNRSHTLRRLPRERLSLSTRGIEPAIARNNFCGRQKSSTDSSSSGHLIKPRIYRGQERALTAGFDWWLPRLLTENHFISFYTSSFSI